MSTPLRRYRRRKTMFDLNVPPIESIDQEGTSTQNVTLDVQPSQQGQTVPVPPATIDVEALDDDDDVIESSSSAFAEAKSNAQRNNVDRRTRASSVVVDADSGTTARLACRRSQTVIDCDQLVNLESISISKSDIVQPPPPPRKEPTFNCPICMGPFKEETSTKCGHIFCKECIKAAMEVQSKCPTCRKRVTIKELFRVFLPATTS